MTAARLKSIQILTSLVAPTGATAGRTATPVAGNLYLNTQTAAIEFYSGSAWISGGGGGGAESDTLASVTGRGATTTTALTLSNATSSTTTGTGALVVTGGVGIGGAVFVGGALSSAGSILATVASGNNARMVGGSSTTAVTFGADSASAGTNVAVAVVPKGTGGLVAALTDSTTTGGNARGASSVDWQTSRSAATNVASGAQSTLAGGQNNTASGTQSTASGGLDNNANGTVAWIPGGRAASTRSTSGRGAWGSGQFSGIGDAQSGEFVLRRPTTDATVTRLTSDNSAASTTNTVNLPNSGSYLVQMLVIARQTGGTAGTAGDTAAWKILALAKRGANAAATALVGLPSITVVAADTAAAAWVVAVAADTTNGGFAVNVTGEANKNINWVARVMSVEVVG